ncbi:MAG TPA: hypothetical protein PKA00_15435, partial [Saprospiraceae bacterium]|nr:hypothetical protein [Saprospiraceae bacterium]
CPRPIRSRPARIDPAGRAGRANSAESGRRVVFLPEPRYEGGWFSCPRPTGAIQAATPKACACRIPSYPTI